MENTRDKIKKMRNANEILRYKKADKGKSRIYIIELIKLKNKRNQSKSEIEMKEIKYLF